ncbi:Predicted DNA-binding transcriptional regulator YafY, contains an HTH and WYL domains [Pseudarcicella hirudinis]|uniref:Predicted DNA-binding transcriptional regulator YafY, contains an HTH and WYL domains n=1 Tax=Pseudarcicella hirudinis TaxID=1079859 RepID=A0A1I5USH9_9BACT|nr:YafY family protein [Pseudarcicella hirudinis]SFP98225.1 Predicted DNA-binding transcriptional regulator YafY, contains an HTH and WYL domains [Pseudarcicella hirudinis]
MIRLNRLTAILIHLQSKRVVKAQEIADRFEISLRTVYRDIRALEETGIPIGAEAGIGYFLEDYHLPPVMFTNNEVSSLLFGAKLVEKLADNSIKESYESALYKIKSVLKHPDQEHLDLLDPSIEISEKFSTESVSSSHLTPIQQAIVQRKVLEIEYFSPYSETTTNRFINPIGLYHYGSGWHLIAFCHTRDDYRDFRVDRIKTLSETSEYFKKHDFHSLDKYLKEVKNEVQKEEVCINVSKDRARYMYEQKKNWGWVSEEDCGDYVKMVFKINHLHGMAHWLLSFGKTVSIERPEKLKSIMKGLAIEIYEHYIS